MKNLFQFISIFLTFSFITFFVKKITFKKSNSKNNEQSNIIKPNKLFFYVSLVCTIFLVLTTILCLILDTTSTKTEKLICCSSISLFAILIGGSLILFSVNYKITVYDDYFVYQNFWRVKKIIYYKDIVIVNSKIYSQIRQILDNGKTKIVFKLAGILENEDIFMTSFNKWNESLNKHEDKDTN